MKNGGEVLRCCLNQFIQVLAIAVFDLLDQSLVFDQERFVGQFTDQMTQELHGLCGDNAIEVTQAGQ